MRLLQTYNLVTWRPCQLEYNLLHLFHPQKIETGSSGPSSGGGGSMWLPIFTFLCHLNLFTLSILLYLRK